MAQRSYIVLEDDIDGSKADETVSFAVDGVSYEIDLNSANAAKLRDALALWTGHARRVGGRRSAGRKPSSGGPTPTEMREWATSQGLKVSQRGRVSAEIREAYLAAH